MSRTSDNDNRTRSQLTVVLVEDDEREPVVAALRQRAHVVDRASIADGVRAAADRRSEAERAGIADLEAACAAIDAQRVSAEQVRDDLVEQQRRTREAADWCDVQPAQDAEGAEQIARSNETLEGHSRRVREANRRLERVLEQRAAAEAALEEARRELGGLGSAGDDETAVRRQMEEASRHVHDVNAAYQATMAELARHKTRLWGLEDSASTAPTSTATTNDPLSSMRAVVVAKIDAAAGATDVAVNAVPPTPEELEEARAAVHDAEQRAATLGADLEGATRSLRDLENELVSRTREVDSRAERRAAAIELESQVAAVERQLADAEERCRADVDEATRSMSRAELGLERLRKEARDRRRQLHAFESLLPVSDRPTSEDDPVLHARVIGSALRTHADAMEPDVAHADDAVDRERARRAGKQDELERRRARLGAILPEDVVATIRTVADGTDLVVIDDAVGADGGGHLLTLATLADVTTSAALLAISTDAAVVSSAIDLPGDHVRVVGKGWLHDLARASTGVDPGRRPPASDQSDFDQQLKP